MLLARIILRELAYRKLNFICGLLSVSMAAGWLVAQLQILKQHDAETDRLLATKEAETRRGMAALEDDYRKITLGLGFNVLILPLDQNLGDLFAEDYASRTMPEEYVLRLAQSRVATIQHLLPTLQRKIRWPETDRTILLAGVRGEVPILQGDRKKPLQEPVPSNTIVLGAELHRSLHLQVGDRVQLLGREFIVGKLHSERGTKDDITAWINLREAQELLEQPGRINGIFALECVCAAESLSKVRAEIARILPDTQVIEFQSQMLARAEARQRATTEARESLAREREHRARLRNELAGFVSVSVPLVVLGAGAWIGFLSLANSRERRVEIGIFCALGLRSGHLLFILLGRAFLMGVGGAVLGACLGLLICQTRHTPNPHLPVPWLLGTLAGAPLLAILATWLPAWHATQQDPAQVLHDP